MRKTILLAVLTLMCSAAVCAQERMSEEERTRAMEERIGRSADRLVKDFDLDEDAKKAFVETYTAYQKEMFATNQLQGQRFGQTGSDDDQKKMSDEEAATKLQENFDRQEQQIAAMQRRLEVQKKYAEEFAKMLTPQQVLKVLTPQRGNGQRDPQQRRLGDNNRRGGNFEGGGRGGFGGGPRGGFGGGPGGF